MLKFNGTFVHFADEIEEVKKVSINFVKEVTNDQGKSPFLFVLVPYEDPGR